MRMLGLRTAGLYQDALFLMEQTLQQLLGIPGDVVDRLDDHSLLAMLGGPENLDSERTEMLAELIKAQGDVFLDQKLQADSDRCYLRALYLLLEAELARPADLPDSYMPKIEPLVQLLQDVEIPEETAFDLFQVYSINQTWQPAMLILDELLANSDSPDGLIETAQDFYMHLLEMTDLELSGFQFDRADLTRRLNNLERS
jgi:hypothetical protein